MKKYNFTGLTHDCGKEFNALAAFNKLMTTEKTFRVTKDLCRITVGMFVIRNIGSCGGYEYRIINIE